MNPYQSRNNQESFQLSSSHDQSHHEIDRCEFARERARLSNLVQILLNRVARLEREVIRVRSRVSESSVRIDQIVNQRK